MYDAQRKIRSVGKYTYGHNFIVTYHWGAAAYIDVGNYCSIANPIYVYLGGNHRIDWASTYPFGHIHHNTFSKFDGTGHPHTKGNVKIGNDVWIGKNSVIMSGVTIGDGACIGCNSVVVKDVPPYSLVAGNPAKFIRYRFDKDIIDKLLESKWWNMKDEDVNELSPLLCSNKFDELFTRIYQIKNGL